MKARVAGPARALLGPRAPERSRVRRHGGGVLPSADPAGRHDAGVPRSPLKSRFSFSVRALAFTGALLCGCRRGGRGASGDGRSTPAVDPARHARHHARGRDRARGARASRRRPSTRWPRAGRRFRQAYATVPETLPSHASMMTGPLSRRPRRARERPLPRAPAIPVARGAAAAARAIARRRSSPAFVLARRFGLARGFDVYDDELPAGARSAGARRRPSARSRYLRGSRERPLLPVGPLLRSRTPPTRRPSRSARRFASAAVPGRGGGDGRAARAPGARRSSSQASGPAAIVVVGRSRRGARRARRGPARQSPLPGDDARAAGARRARASRRAWSTRR